MNKIIITDSRESNNDDGQTILRLLHHPSLMLLDHGDYLIRGTQIALIERVTASGLVQDISSGRIVDKLSGCAGDADIVILLVEGLILRSDDGFAMIQYKSVDQRPFDLPRNGPFSKGVSVKIEFRETRWQYNTIQEFLTSACLRWCHKVEFTTSPQESAERIMQMDKYFCKPAEQHTLHLRRSRPFTMSRKKDKREQQEYILSAFPDISAGRAKSIIDHFGTIPIQWSIDKKIMMSVPGIGKILAKKLLEVLE